jgi:hypothetical protein
LEEVQERCTAGTGCQHDADMIWTGELCVPESPVLVAQGNANNLDLTSCESQTYMGEITSNMISCGNPNHQNCLPDSCASPEELHEVRCCSDTQLTGYQQKNGCEVWAESQFASVGCASDRTFEEAAGICAGDNARLCTLEEVQNGCTAGTGCSHDEDMIWTNATCPVAAPLPTTHEVRCCSDTQLPGYQQKNGCDVWAESQFSSVGAGNNGCSQR